MFIVFKSTLTPMLMMFICIAIGYFLNKKKLLPENADKTLSRLETCLLLPALNISTFMNNCTPESLYSYRFDLLISLGITIVAVLIAYPLSRCFAKEEYQRNIYKYALTFGNFGFLGNAIVPIILGEEFLYPYLLYSMPPTIICYIWGMSILIPKSEQKGNPFKSLLNPSVMSIFIGIILGLSGVEKFVPQFVKVTLSNLTACMGPVGMLLTGIVVAKFSLPFLIKKKAIYPAVALRLIILPLIFYVILHLLNVDGLIIKLSFFIFATPFGLNTVVFPTAYGGDASTGASMALVSHVISVITIPIMFALLSIAI